MTTFTWLPIQGAPKDGRKILACGIGGDRYDLVVVSYRGYHPAFVSEVTWRDVFSKKVNHLTHWMPLPEHPNTPVKPGAAEDLIEHLTTAIQGTDLDQNPSFEDAFTQKHWWNKVRHLVARWDTEQRKTHRLPLVGQSCHAVSDGECSWQYCPQLEEHEPTRHCPLDINHGDA